MLNWTLIKYGGIVISVLLIIIVVFDRGAELEKLRLQPLIEQQKIQIKNLQDDLAQEKLNKKVVTKYVYKIKTIAQKQDSVKQDVLELKKYDADCKIPDKFIESHDSLVESLK